MVKLKKGLLVITLVSLIMLSIRPFDIYADTISTSNVIGIEPRVLDYNVSVNPQSQNINGTTYAAVDYVLEFVVKLDSYYYGEITGDLSFYWDSYNLTSSSATPVRNQTNINNKTYFVNGNSFIISYNLRAIQIVNISHEDLLDPYYTITFTVDSSNIIDYGVMMNDNKWNIPIESYSIVADILYKNNYNEISTFNHNYFNYPMFKFNSGTVISSSYLNSYSSYALYLFGIIGDSLPSNTATLSNYFSLNRGSFAEYKSIFFNGNVRIFSFKIARDTEGNYNLSCNNPNVYYIPIFSSREYELQNKNFTTDFALLYGFSNQLLDDLHIIAQGTQQSSSSASSLESSTSSFSSTASDVYNVEDQVSSGFSSSMQNIPSSFNFQNNFGSSFVVSASWVRDQFNNMTANNPFGSLITFSLILGVALLIIGRLLS